MDSHVGALPSIMWQRWVNFPSLVESMLVERRVPHELGMLLLIFTLILLGKYVGLRQRLQYRTSLVCLPGRFDLRYRCCITLSSSSGGGGRPGRGGGAGAGGGAGGRARPS